ncbi:MAG: hypothetical protein JO290_01170, partial [Sphingomonadaceae bacterium]|nr:hypothetical protein [Sphingomonadaceae bacterium]
MAITAAQVEPNGWVLRLTLSGALSSAIVGGFSLAESNPVTTQWATNFSAYALAPNGASPALTLAIQTSGYVQSGGQAVASATVARTLIGTKALRKAVVATPAGVRNAKNPDEVDNGDGTITVRIALSQYVYAGDTNLTLTALAGWRTGDAGGSGIAVTNNSTVPAPAPIVRWTDVPYQRQTGTFTLECAVASHHPNGLAPVAGVKFTVTDGTTVKSFWATALAASTTYSAGGTGKDVRVYSAPVDPTTATALTQGLLRCDFEAYPWIGPVQKSDAAGTKSMTGLGTAGLSTAAQVPFVVAWDPTGTWIVPRYAYVDPVNGSSTAAAANVSTNPATAAATPLASISLAVESLRLGLVTVAAANGQAAAAQSVDGCVIRLKAGTTSGAGTTGAGSGTTTLSSWLIVEGDPADGNPLADCILAAPSVANGNIRATKVLIRNLKVTPQTQVVLGALNVWLSNVELRAVSGFETTTGTPFGVTNALLWATNVKWWKWGTGLSVSGSSQSPVLVRNAGVERGINAPAVFNCARLATAVSGTFGVSGSAVTAPSTDAGASLDRMIIGCDMRYLNGAGGIYGQFLANASLPAAQSALALGTTFPVLARWAAINNVGEVYGSSNPLWNSVGENNPSAFAQCIVEGNSLVGDRTNNPYGDLNMATVALNDSTDTKVSTFRFANNVTLKNASKHDAFNDPAVQTQRTGVTLAATRNRAYTVGT